MLSKEVEDASSRLLSGAPVSYTHLDVYKRQSLRYADGDRWNCRTGPIDAHPEGSVAEIRPEEKHYGRWYGVVSKFEDKTFVPDFIEGLAHVQQYGPRIGHSRSPVGGV